MPMTDTRPPSTAGSTAGLRTCAACRTRILPAGLVRFTHEGATWRCVVPGTTQQGRGISLCPSAACFQRACAARKSRFAEAGARPAARDLLGQCIESYQDRIRLLRRSGGQRAAEALETVLSQLSNALLTLPPGRSGETHVR
jgi:predicted RNA-binding protein YlxR (DUF448 family)